MLVATLGAVEVLEEAGPASPSGEGVHGKLVVLEHEEVGADQVLLPLVQGVEATLDSSGQEEVVEPLASDQADSQTGVRARFALWAVRSSPSREEVGAMVLRAPLALAVN